MRNPMVQVRDRQCYIVACDSARLDKYIRSTPQVVGVLLWARPLEMTNSTVPQK